MSQNAPAPASSGSSSDPADRVREALDQGDLTTVEAILRDLHPADQVKLLNQLPDDERDRCLDLYEPGEIGQLFSESHGRLREYLLDYYPADTLSDVVQELDSDEAADLLQGLEGPTADRVLARLSFEDRAEVEPLLSYPEDTAGGRMQREVFVVPAKTRAQRVLGELRRAAQDLEEIPNIYLVDNRGVLTGVISIFQLLRLELPTPVVEGANMDPLYVTPDEDQEAVAGLFRKHRLQSLPVVDDTGRILGQITADDILGVMEEEATEDLYRLANINESSDLTEPVLRSARRRVFWLVVNGFSALLAATIISLFEPSIAQLTALAVLMPIVASMGGIAGVQTLTVMVRGIALGHVQSDNTSRIIARQAGVGLVMGVLFALLGSVLAWLWFGKPLLGVAMGLALVINLFASGLFGSIIPLVLRHLKIDPALASGVLLNTLTDGIGFFSFLALGTWILL
jgi:magnesium transporter